MMERPFLTVVTGLAGVFLIALPAAAEVYKWNDASGEAHYSDRPPVEKPGDRNVQAKKSILAGANSSTTAKRLTFDNKCGDDVWIISIPPGDKRAVQAQWDWLQPYADKTHALPNGGTAVALRLSAGKNIALAVPDSGAPGGNFRFYMNCPDGDPFATAGCTIGAAAGDLSAINTLFEPTFGCKPGLSSAECAFNPSGDAVKWPNCASSPGRGNCPPMPSGDNFDVSAVDGYTVPLKVVAVPAEGTTCNRNVTDAGMLDLASCPTEDATTLYTTEASQQALIDKGISLLTQTTKGATTLLRACSAPFHWFQTDTLGKPTSPLRVSGECNPANSTFTSQCFYAGAGCNTSDRVKSCPGGSGPQQRVGPKGNGKLAIHNTHWVQSLYGLGYRGYTWQYGDGVGDQACGWGADITVTLCPAGGVPYRAGQLWQFSATTGACSTDGSTGKPDGSTTFGSLAKCQEAKMLYVCDNQTDDDPYKIPSAMWRADPEATRTGKGFTAAWVAESRRLVCTDLTFTIPGQGKLTLPQCNYVYGIANAPCPSSHPPH